MNDVDLGVCRSSSRLLKYASLRSKADEGAGLPLAALKKSESSSSKYNASKHKVAAKYEVKKRRRPTLVLLQLPPTLRSVATSRA